MSTGILSIQKISQPEKEAFNRDIAYLLGLIRQRETLLTFAIDSYQHYQQLSILTQFKIKEQQISRCIRQTFIKYALLKFSSKFNECQNMRSFWLKVKTIVKLSLESLKNAGVLNYDLFRKYEEMVGLINQHYDFRGGILDYREVEEEIKFRNRNILERIKGGKELHDELAKRSEAIANNVELLNENQHAKIVSRIKCRSAEKMKVRNRPSSHFLKKTENVKAIKKKVGKEHKTFNRIQGYIGELQKNFQDVMDGRVQMAFDRKKHLKENLDCIYSTLMARNVMNQRSITKFLFSKENLAFKSKKLEINRKLVKKQRLVLKIKQNNTQYKTIKNKCPSNKLSKRKSLGLISSAKNHFMPQLSRKKNRKTHGVTKRLPFLFPQKCKEYRLLCDGFKVF